jgi:hypothetical protein
VADDNECDLVSDTFGDGYCGCSCGRNVTVVGGGEECEPDDDAEQLSYCEFTNQPGLFPPPLGTLPVNETNCAPSWPSGRSKAAAFVSTYTTTAPDGSSPVEYASEVMLFGGFGVQRDGEMGSLSDLWAWRFGEDDNAEGTPMKWEYLGPRPEPYSPRALEP